MRPNGAFLGAPINEDGALRPDANSEVSVYRYNMHNNFNAKQENQWVAPGDFAGLVPLWETESGNIGANTAGAPVTFSVAATKVDTYTIASGSLPDGMVLNESNGFITGTPTGTDVTDYSNTTFTFQVAALNQYSSNIREFSIKIESRYVGYLCGTTGEGGTITITAPSGYVLNRKDFSHYGTYSGSCPTYTRGGCSSASAAAWAPTLPAASVSFVANNATWGDPCSGTGKSGVLVMSYGPDL